MHFVGIFWIFNKFPIWLIAAILFLVIPLPILVGRDVFEGMPYQVSYSAAVGDAGFIIIVLLAASIFQRAVSFSYTFGNSSLLYKWQWSGKVHCVILAICVIFGAIVSYTTLASRSGQLMDIYHDVVIAPLFLYLAIMLLPLIWVLGNTVEKRTTVLLILLWAGLVVFDAKQDRLNQRRWLEHHGVTLRK